MARLASSPLSLGTLALLFTRAWALDFNVSANIPNTGTFRDQIVICDKAFNATNCTGISTFTPGISPGSKNQGNGTAFGSELRWGFAGAENANTSSPFSGLQISLLLDTGNATFLDNTKLGYDACAIAVDPGALNANTFLRGQTVNSNGSCLSMLDSDCVGAIQDRLNSVAKKWNVPINPDGSKQGRDKLQSICNSIYLDILHNLPPRCSPFFSADANAWIGGYATLTQPPGTSYATPAGSCNVTGSDNAKYYNIQTIMTRSYSDAWYDIMTTFAWPMVTVFMPIAAGDLTGHSVISSPFTDVTCIRTDHITPGSRAQAIWPAAAPVDYSSLQSTNTTTTTNSTTSATPPATSSPAAASAGVSGGTIAGAVIGALALVALLAAAGYFLVRRKRTQRNAVAVTELDAGLPHNEKRPYLSNHTEVPAESLHEMSPDSYRRSELPYQDTRKHELPAYTQRHEMEAPRPPIELPGDYPGNKPKLER